MKFYTKRIIQFTAFGLIGLCMYSFDLRFIKPITQAEIIAHTLATVTSLLLSALGFFGAAYYCVRKIFSYLNDYKTVEQKSHEEFEKDWKTYMVRSKEKEREF